MQTGHAAFLFHPSEIPRWWPGKELHNELPEQERARCLVIATAPQMISHTLVWWLEGQVDRQTFHNKSPKL